jgi:hypothetical protein
MQEICTGDPIISFQNIVSFRSGEMQREEWIYSNKIVLEIGVIYVV